MDRLLDSIQLTKAIQLLCIIQRIQLIFMANLYIQQMANPAIHKAKSISRKGCLHTTTAVVATNDDVFHFQVFHRIVDDC